MNASLPLPELAAGIAAGLRSSGSCSALPGTHEPRDLFDAVRAIIPVVGVVSKTGRTLHLAVVTEDVRHLGNNDRINVRTSLAHAEQVRRWAPERVWS